MTRATDADTASTAPTPERLSFGEATRVWAKIGFLSFGGPAGQIALMHKELVEQRKWVDEERFLHALNYCMLLPGPEAQQLATYLGWLLHKTRGGLVAGLLFVLPGFLSILGLSLLYASFRSVPAVAAVFFGLKAAVLATFGSESVFVKEGIFFSKTAVVTFGGAYAVLAYIAQRAVETYGWLEPGEMLDGLGLAETTPGPLIMVVQFVGFLGAFRHPGNLSPLLAGTLGSLVTVWVTFVPCFFWIFLGAPYIEALRGNRALHAALSTVTAAVVGVILNLSLWFGLHVMFRQVAERKLGPLRFFVPELASLDLASTTISALAMLAMFRFKVGLPKTLAGSALLGAAWKLLL